MKELNERNLLGNRVSTTRRAIFRLFNLCSGEQGRGSALAAGWGQLSFADYQRTQFVSCIMCILFYKGHLVIYIFSYSSTYLYLELVTKYLQTHGSIER